MISGFNHRISLIALKYLVLAIALFTIGAQIGFAMWGKYIIFSVYPTLRRRSSTQRMGGSSFSTEVSEHKIRRVEIGSATVTKTSEKSTSENASTTANDQEITIGTAEWKTSGMECLVRTNFSRSPDDKRSFKELPEKYVTTLWPPVSRNECGIHGLLKPWMTAAVKNPWMLFIVKSAPHHYLLRNTIRSTWGAISSFYSRSIVTIFLLGLPKQSNNTASLQEALAKENALFGDILQCDVDDSYKNLPEKVLDSFLWLLKQNYRGSFYTLTDDDCVMRIPNIYLFFNHLTEQEGRGTVYCGFLYDRDNKAIRAEKSKWSISASEYSASYYPTFCHGGMYTMKRPLVKSLFCMSQVTNTSGFYLEDVLVTGILREKIGRGDSNIKPVVTKTGRKLELMYYPWDDNQYRALAKMTRKWASWNRTLTQYYQRNLVKSRDFKYFFQRPEFQDLHDFWKLHATVNNTRIVNMQKKSKTALEFVQSPLPT